MSTIDFRALGLTALLAGLLVLPARAEEEAPVAKARAELVAALARGQPQDLLVLFRNDDLRAQALGRRHAQGAPADSRDIIQWRAQRFAERKRNVLDRLPRGRGQVLVDYRHLPIAYLRVDTPAALDALLRDEDILSVGRPLYFEPATKQSLPLIGQPGVARFGHKGAGTIVAVLDHGVRYDAVPVFGACDGVGGKSCRLLAIKDCTGAAERCRDDRQAVESDHGTNVAGIVAAVAPSARILSYDVFTAEGASDVAILKALDEVIEDRDAYPGRRITAVNLSVAHPDLNWAGSGPCGLAELDNEDAKRLVVAIDLVRAAGIPTVVAAGNDADAERISFPACAPGVISVGATYDGSGGSVDYDTCTDTGYSADTVACFSNSSPLLTLLAPGAVSALYWKDAQRVEQSAMAMSGTSQAAPHVAGAIAVLREICPDESVEQTTARLTATGNPVRDGRNDLIKPRLNLAAAVGASHGCSGVSVIAPNGGEQWVAGGTYTLSWNHYGAATPAIRIELIEGAGATPNRTWELASSQPVSDDHLLLTLPADAPPSSYYRVRLGAVGESPPLYTDTSDGYFTLGPWAPPLAPATRANDTGITTCADAAANGLPCPADGFPGQDADHGRDRARAKDSDGHAGFSFTKLDSWGNPLNNGAAHWYCVRDNVTALTWEEKANDAGLRDKDYTYTWYDPNPTTNGGAEGVAGGGQCAGDISCDTYHYVLAVNAQGLCGYRDWRLPEVDELASLVDYGVASPGPTLDTRWFPNSNGWGYWSASPLAGNAASAWLVYFNYGYANWSYRSAPNAVRLVRGGPAR